MPYSSMEEMDKTEEDWTRQEKTVFLQAIQRLLMASGITPRDKCGKHNRKWMRAEGGQERSRN